MKGPAKSPMELADEELQKVLQKHLDRGSVRLPKCVCSTF